jgi:hypothetical protein
MARASRLLDGCAQRGDVSHEDIGRHRLRLSGGEWQRPSGPGIVRIPRHDVSVEVRYRVSEQVVVELDGAERLVKSPTDCEDLTPVLGGLLLFKVGWLGDVAPLPDDHGEAALDVGASQVGVHDQSRFRTDAGQNPEKPSI